MILTLSWTKHGPATPSSRGGAALKTRPACVWLTSHQCVIHHLLGFLHDRIQVGLVPKTLRVDLVYVLRTGWPGGKPSVGCDNLQPANRGVIAGSTRQLRDD